MLVAAGAVTEAEVRAHYEANRHSYDGGSFLRASHILVKVPATAPPEQEKAALEKLRGLQARLAQGEAFADLARAHSDDPGMTGVGDLRPFGRGRMVASFEDVAFALAVDEVSEPVRTRYGYHLIQVTHREERRRRPYEEVREGLRSRLRLPKTSRARRATLERLRAAATIEERLPSVAPVEP